MYIGTPLPSKHTQFDFNYEFGLTEMFPLVHLLKAFLEDVKKASDLISEDHSNAGHSVVCFLSLNAECNFLFYILLRLKLCAALASAMY